MRPDPWLRRGPATARHRTREALPLYLARRGRGALQRRAAPLACQAVSPSAARARPLTGHGRSARNFVHGTRTRIMPTIAEYPIEGGCACKRIRYRMESKPLFVHCCHCRWCQRESGSSFALNAMIESDRIANLGDDPELVRTPSESGLGQLVARCPHCKVAVWSNYAGAGPVVRFVRVGTLDSPDPCPPDIHIFTRSKQSWVNLSGGAPAVPEYYDREEFWPPDSLRRREALLPAIRAYRATLESGA